MSELTFKIIVTEKKKDQTYTCLYTGTDSESVREKFLDHLREIGDSENLYDIRIQILARGNRVDRLDSTWVILDSPVPSLNLPVGGINTQNDLTQEGLIKRKSLARSLLDKFEKIHQKINPSRLFKIK